MNIQNKIQWQGRWNFVHVSDKLLEGGGIHPWFCKWAMFRVLLHKNTYSKGHIHPKNYWTWLCWYWQSLLNTIQFQQFIGKTIRRYYIYLTSGEINWKGKHCKDSIINHEIQATYNVCSLRMIKFYACELPVVIEQLFFFHVGMITWLSNASLPS